MPMELDEATRTFLDEPNVAVLATVSPKGRLQATPIWYLLEDGHILINTAKGRVKLRNLEAHPYLALTVVDPKDMYRYIQVQGRVARIDHANAARDIDRLSQRYTGQPYSYRYGGGPQDRVSILIRPLSISGMGRR